ncbi:MAG: hypothetical protein GX642_08185 [Smithella sp.]|nr:hypothetical protein [Smithella sp.]
MRSTCRPRTVKFTGPGIRQASLTRWRCSRGAVRFI